MVENKGYEKLTHRGLDELLAPYFAQYHRDRRYPGLILEQGKRKMVQINVPGTDLPALLQAQPSTNNYPDSGKNRPEVKDHVNEIKEYILKRAKKGKPWILGTLTANVNPEEITIIELGRGICFVVIPREVRLDITDGQHRKRAIQELILSSESALIADSDFPITLVLEDDFNQCQTDFKDMAQTRPLEKSLILSFGEFEGRVGITKHLIDHVLMFKDKTEKIKNSPNTKQKLIYTTNYIAKMVSCAFANDPNNELKDCDVEILSEDLGNCLNQFFSECKNSQYIAQTPQEKLTLEDVKEFRENCLLGRSAGLEILGRLLFCAYNQEKQYFNREQVSEIAEIDWSRQSKIWEGNVVLSTGRIVANVSAVKMAIKSAKENLGWA
jgi:DNA sulfur modification protein DndB